MLVALLLFLLFLLVVVPTATATATATPIPVNVSGICDIGNPKTGDCTVTTNHVVYCQKTLPSAHYNVNWNICSPGLMNFAGNLYFQGNGSITCESYGTGPAQIPQWVPSQSRCAASNSRNVPSLCELVLNVTKNMHMKDFSSIISDSLLLNVTGTLEMDTHTVINVSAHGVPSLPCENLGCTCKPPGQPPTSKKSGLVGSYGASHAGSGGIGGSVSSASPYLSNVVVPYTALIDGNSGGHIIGNVSSFPFNTTDNEWGFSGVARGYSRNGEDQKSAGRGGGRIKITALGTMTLNGAVLAQGGDATALNDPVRPSEYIQCCGGGSGGTILLSSKEILGTGVVSTMGGNAALVTMPNKDLYLRGAGGGGRVLLNFSNTQPGGDVTSLTIDAYGGAVEDVRSSLLSMLSMLSLLSMLSALSIFLPIHFAPFMVGA